ncbi:ankyrin repeat domain-containing protein [Maribacter aurantiacus]|uniref:Ankyrin repeat domain-containing protein n=1 Tax=Maribacter aurantiacus TaxID=1882343 RepID=A0A5R8MAD6_9FLAO|nr:ankyrin repeat domain-containing protein [Maribacter aurantiacus]TLF45709.1 ankyrin repeat domain-containing protein [Maribacter aurantiacus]
MKIILSAISTLVFCVGISAQENPFLKRDYWNNNPSIQEVEATIQEGHDITERNAVYFDGPTYAILQKVNTKTMAHIIAKEGNGVAKLTHDGRIYLHWAAYAGNLELVKYLLDQGSDAAAVDAHGYSVINFAANSGVTDTQIFDALLENGADVKATTHNGANALLLASSGADTFELLQYFMDKGLPLNSADDTGNGVFQYASRGGNISVLKTLAEKGLEYKKVNTEGENALFMAARGTRRKQNNKEVFDYLEGLGLSNQLINNEGRNLLHLIAGRNKDLPLFEHFIASGVSTNLKDKKGQTPFMIAASGNDLEVVELLAKHVEDINLTDDKGRNALMMAVERNNTDVVDFLLERGADVSALDTDGNSVAYYLIQNYNPQNTAQFEEKWNVLLVAGLSMTEKQGNGNTLLHLAAKANNLALLKRLEGLEIDVNQKNGDGITALHFAAMSSDNEDMLKYLIQRGANISAKTEFEETVYDLASENELLQKHNVALDFLKI